MARIQYKTNANTTKGKTIGIIGYGRLLHNRFQSQEKEQRIEVAGMKLGSLMPWLT